MAPNLYKIYAKIKKPNPSSQKPNKMMRGTQKTTKKQIFLGHQPRPGPWDLKNIGFIWFFWYLTAFYLVFVEMDFVFLVLHCLFWVLNEKCFIYIIFFWFSCISPIFTWSLACFNSMRQLLHYSSGDHLYSDLHHTLLRCVNTYPWCRIHNLKKYGWTGSTWPS